MSSNTPGGTLSGDLERPCCWHLFADVMYFCSAFRNFLEKNVIDLCGYSWCVSSVFRNRCLHALHGNGPPKGNKGKSKGKGKSKDMNQPGLVPSTFASSSQPSSAFGDGKGAVESSSAIAAPIHPIAVQEVDSKAEAERAFKEQMLAALPSHLSSTASMLVEEEWNTKVVPAHELSAHGGVALVAKKDLPAVVAKVGQTTRATAIVTSQPAHELYMGAAPCREIYCSLLVPTESGITKVSVKKYLIQLGIASGAQVQMETANLQTIQESITMNKVVIRFNPHGGWEPKMMRAIIVSDYLRNYMPESAFSNIVIREDGSATALVHSSKMISLLRHSGEAHVYCKPHMDVVEWQDMEILWLPPTLVHSEALKLVSDHASSLGLAIKQNQEFTRFGLRFRNLADMQSVATLLGLSHETQLGRFKITAVSDAAGPAGVIEMMNSIKWQIEEVIYVGEGHGIVAAKDCPGQNKYRLQRQDGLALPMWVHAVNSRARELFKAKNITHRNTDGEGEDVAMAEAVQPAVVAEKLKAASSQAKTRTQEQQSLRRTREPTGNTPAKEAKQRLEEQPKAPSPGHHGPQS
eukprot:s1703_g19.t1